MSELALGTAQLGLNYGIANRTGRPDRDAALGLLEASRHCGVTLWDTAPAYGESEEIIGNFLRSQSDHPAISTKLSKLESTGAEELVSIVERALTRSLDRLGIDAVDYYLIHDERDFGRFGEDLLTALAAMRDRGLVQKIGVSVYHPETALRALASEHVDALQLPYNVFDRRFDLAIQEARPQGVVVLARSVYLQGLFFLEEGDIAAKFPEALSWSRELQRFSGEIDRPIAELAFCFVRDVPGISAMIVGAESLHQLEENSALMKRPPLTTEEREEVSRRFAHVPESIVNPSLWEYV